MTNIFEGEVQKQLREDCQKKLPRGSELNQIYGASFFKTQDVAKVWGSWCTPGSREPAKNTALSQASGLPV